MAGARHSKADMAHIAETKRKAREIAQHMDDLGFQEEEAPGQECAAKALLDDTLVYFGGEIKALGDGRVGGYLVRFSDAKTPDLTGDFFTKDTDFGSAKASLVYYHHGLDAKLQKRRMAHDAEIGVDEVGVWIKHQLELRDEYEKAVYGMAEKKALGWSSGTAGHLVEREPAGQATWVKAWPLGLDASYTPTPAEPRNVAVSLKSLISVETPGQAAPDGANAAKSIPTQAPSSKEKIMDEVEVKALKDSIAARDVEIAAIKKQNDEILAELRKPVLDTRPVQIVATEPEKPFKNLGEQLTAIKDIAIRAHTPEQANRIDAVKAYNLKANGANEAISSEGGFLIQTDFSAQIFQRSYDVGILGARCVGFPISGQANGTKINAVDEQSRANGSRWGGILSYWASEAASVTATKTKWRQMSLELKKLFTLMYATDEQLQDSTQLESYAMQTVPMEIAFRIDDGLVNGLGGGLPMGILNAGCLVTVAKEAGQAANTILWDNIKKMRARVWGRSRANMVWLVNQDCEPQLQSMVQTVGVGGVPVYLPASGASSSPYDTLFGRPVIPFEQCSTLGTVGDVIAADFSQYALATKGGVQAAQSIHVAFLTDEVAFRWIYRLDGLPLWNTALTPYKGSNTLSPFVALATRS